MTKWKLCRQAFGSEEFTLTEGDEVTIGRSISNTIALSSVVISRNHCVLDVQKNKVLITDLKSSNGVYVGLTKIPQNKPYTLRDEDVIGIGWIAGAPLAEINNEEKYVFKLRKETLNSISNRIQFQNENDLDEIEDQVAALHCNQTLSPKNKSPVLNHKLSLKRKVDNANKLDVKLEIKEEKKFKYNTDDDIVNLLSDSENELQKKPDYSIKNIKLESICEEPRVTMKDKIKCESDDIEFDAFDVKQEYLGYDDEPIKVDSDSDSESEHWYLRLSQSSPGKPFIRKSQDKVESKQDESSYSQMDDEYISFADADNEEEEYLDDLIKIPPEPPKHVPVDQAISDDEDHDDLISLNIDTLPTAEPIADTGKDEVDAFSSNQVAEHINNSVEAPVIEPKNTLPGRKALLTEAINRSYKAKPKAEEKKSKSYSSRHSKIKKHSNRRHISQSQKDERKRRLRDIATKEKGSDPIQENSSNSSKGSSTAVNKITSCNRGAFLTDSVHVVKPVTRKESPKNQNKSSSSTSPKTESLEHGDNIPSVDVENIKKQTDVTNNECKSSKTKSKHDTSRSLKTESKTKEVRMPLQSLKPETERDDASQIKSCHNKSHHGSSNEGRVPLKSVKPLTENETYSGKPISKVEPLPPKKEKKCVRFSEAGPEIHVFEIEPGNRMKKTSLVKMSLLDTRQMPVFSLEKITLMKILRWNPNWLHEQKKNDNPPPILGHNNPPMSTFHSYANHHQYVQMIGDLLLMEIWECLTMAYEKIQDKNIGLPMRIGSLPPIPTQERCYELFSLSVDISLPSNSPKQLVPRVGEIILMTFGPENAKTKRFFFVHNVRLLPSPSNNIHSFYSVSLHATFTDKMKTLKQGEVMTGVSLAYINKELNLFEAMEYLAGSPLSEAILKPEPRHFQSSYNPGNEIKSQWTKTLNPSQQVAVTCSVRAALGDKPSIQMVQGPPGTGKSSVICAMVMTYYFDEQGRRPQSRGKVLICATSNAAVDELVIRLLNIRQSLPKAERFRMVRVGRAEAMHSRARDVSSQQLAQRDAVRAHAEPAPSHPGLHEEISHLEAKINMWKTAAQDAKDPVRVAYCQGRVSDLVKRITLMKSGGAAGGGEELRPDQLIAAERRIIEGADIIVTTLASAHNHKMKGLKRRIALCIIDEAGQAIEPETLIPLTLDVTRLTLIGDPQQLPGYICSQQAKQHGLGESLFSRLTSSAEQWPGGSPVVLLNQQYRMHPDIADYPNRAFYGGKVLSVAPQRPLDLVIPPYAILSISSGDKGQGSSGANEMEARGVSRLVAALNVTLRARNLNLAVITPYNAHKELIKKHLRVLQDPSEPPVEVNTVDSFQGQERDVVVVSLARSQGVGFLTDAGRMNVMLTRAKHALLICLNPHALVKNNQWRTLLEDAQRRNMFKTLPNDMCQPTLKPHDDILKYISVGK